MHAVVVTFECLPVSMLGCYGNLRARTPRLDALATESVLFDACYAQDLSPGVEEHSALREELSAAGIRCVDWCGAAWDGAFDQGELSCVHVRWPAVLPPWNPPAELLAEGTPAITPAIWRDGLVAALGEEASQPLLKETETVGGISRAIRELTAADCLQEAAIQQHPEAAPLLRAIFAACVSELDRAFGKWLDDVIGPRIDDLLLIVMGRAGGLLVPHPPVQQGCPRVVDPVVRVPLLIRIPRSDQAGTRRSGIVRTRDVVPTLRQWLSGGEAPGTPDACSLWPLLTGETETIRRSTRFRCEGIGAGIRDERFSCLVPESLLSRPALETCDLASPVRPWLFVKPDDAWDMLDVSRQHPDEVERLVGELLAAEL